MKIAIIGGDKRIINLIDLLLKDDYYIRVFGFDLIDIDSLSMSRSLEEAIQDVDIVIGPFPCSKDNKKLDTPFNSREINIEDLFKNMTENQLFISGKITKEISEIADKYNIVTMDLLKREELAVLNAIPTAEGAIQLAMEEMDTTIHGSNIMILGFGRIGKYLAKIIDGLGGNVFVMARSYKDRAWIKTYGYNPLSLIDYEKYLGDMNLVFNTIPSMILTKENLRRFKRDTLIVDLASKPGGVDFENAKELGIKAILALGLPGKVAPGTAADIIKESIYNIMEGMEV